eukprot:356995-Chlamydomonas_euryale.AAC.18
MRECAIGEDGVRNLRVGHEVDVQQLGLQRRVLWLVACERLQQKRRRLADHIALQEQVGDRVDVKRWRRLLDAHFGERDCAGRVGHQHALQHVHVVELLAGLASVRDQRVHVTLLGQDADDLASRTS